MRPARLPVLAALLLLAACDAAPTPVPATEPREHVVTVTDAWVRLSPIPGRPAAGYFTAEAAAMPETITNVTSPSPGRVEMHESMDSLGMSSMQELEIVDFEPGEPLVFEPGGKHLMLFSLDPTVKPGGTLALTLTFSRARPVTVEAKVIAAGDPPPE